MSHPLLAGALALAIAAPLGAPQDAPYTFVVLGHVRGGATGELSPKLPELLQRVRAERPAFVVINGDLIWGDIDHNPARTEVLERQWTQLDSALATLGVPVYRTPGNHDISDLPSRDVWTRRYGPPAHVERIHGSRFIFVPSPWIPQDGDTRHNPFVRPTALDSLPLAWLQGVLRAPGEWPHSFVFMHHLFWWDSTASWYRDVHPLLGPAGVRWVFGGDLGPLKFSWVTRDSVRYVQSSMEAGTQLQTLRNLEKSRLLSSQFDTYLVVRVDGPAVDVAVRTFGEFSNPMFTPERYTAMLEPVPVPASARWAAMFSVKRVLAGLLVLLTGTALGWRLARRRA